MNEFTNTSARQKNLAVVYGHICGMPIRNEKKRYGKADIPNKVMIVERPSVVDEKTRIGDFELDTIIGKGHKGVV